MVQDIIQHVSGAQEAHTTPNPAQHTKTDIRNRSNVCYIVAFISRFKFQ